MWEGLLSGESYRMPLGYLSRTRYTDAGDGAPLYQIDGAHVARHEGAEHEFF